MEVAAMCEAAAMVKDEEMMGKDEKEINHQRQQQHGRDSLKVHNKKRRHKIIVFPHFCISHSTCGLAMNWWIIYFDKIK